MPAGSITMTMRPPDSQSNRPVRKVKFAWTSDAAGAVNGIKTDGTGSPTIVGVAAAPAFISGTIVGVTFIPSASAAPTALYDVTLKDDEGVDVLAGQGADLSATVTTRVKPGQSFKDGTTTSLDPIPIDDVLELVVTNAGNAKQGTVVLYLR